MTDRSRSVEGVENGHDDNFYQQRHASKESIKYCQRERLETPSTVRITRLKKKPTEIFRNGNNHHNDDNNNNRTLKFNDGNNSNKSEPEVPLVKQSFVKLYHRSRSTIGGNLEMPPSYPDLSRRRTKRDDAWNASDFEFRRRRRHRESYRNCLWKQAVDLHASMSERKEKLKYTPPNGFDSMFQDSRNRIDKTSEDIIGLGRREKFSSNLETCEERKGKIMKDNAVERRHKYLGESKAGTINIIPTFNNIIDKNMDDISEEIKKTAIEERISENIQENLKEKAQKYIEKPVVERKEKLVDIKDKRSVKTENHVHKHAVHRKEKYFEKPFFDRKDRYFTKNDLERKEAKTELSKENKGRRERRVEAIIENYDKRKFSHKHYNNRHANLHNLDSIETARSPRRKIHHVNSYFENKHPSKYYESNNNNNNNNFTRKNTFDEITPIFEETKHSNNNNDDDDSRFRHKRMLRDIPLLFVESDQVMPQKRRRKFRSTTMPRFPMFTREPSPTPAPVLKPMVSEAEIFDLVEARYRAQREESLKSITEARNQISAEDIIRLLDEIEKPSRTTRETCLNDFHREIQDPKYFVSVHKSNPEIYKSKGITDNEKSEVKDHLVVSLSKSNPDIRRTKSIIL